jgi:hypothetical protein
MGHDECEEGGRMMERKGSTSFCEQKEAKKLSIHWSVRSLRRSAVARRIKSFLVLFFKKEHLLERAVA